MRHKLLITASAAAMLGAGVLGGLPAVAGTPGSVYIVPAYQQGTPSFELLPVQNRWWREPGVIYAPPPPSAPAYDEPVPPPRRGQVWIPGHWEYQGDNYYWVHGKFEAARSGYYYRQPEWQQDGNRWAYRGGGWIRGLQGRNTRPSMNNDLDSDGDGVPNRLDRLPADPNNH